MTTLGKMVFVSGFVFSLNLIIISNSYSESLGFSIKDSSDPEVAVLVLDDETLAPIQGAQVIISKLRQEKGSNSLMLTVIKEGYVRFSLIGNFTNVTVYLKPSPAGMTSHLVAGNFQGWDPLPGKKLVQLGLNFKCPNVLEFLDFQTGMFFSPIKDTINVHGDRQVPSNLVLPDQTVSYSFFNIRLNKPEYHWPLFPTRPLRLVAFEATSKVSDLMGAVQGGYTADILNKINFGRVGLTDVFMPQSGLHKDIALGYVLTPKQYQVISAQPSFKADVLVASFLDLDGNRQAFLPFDVKTAATLSQPNVLPVDLAGMKLKRRKVLTGVEQVLTVAVGENSKLISGILSPAKGGKKSLAVTPGVFLPVVPVEDYTQLPTVIKTQAFSQGIRVMSFYKTQAIPSFDFFLDLDSTPPTQNPEITYPVWTVAVLPGAGEVSVSTEGLDGIKQYSISTLDFGPIFNQNSIDVFLVLKALSRFSKSVALLKTGDL